MLSPGELRSVIGCKDCGALWPPCHSAALAADGVQVRGDHGEVVKLLVAAGAKVRSASGSLIELQTTQATRCAAESHSATRVCDPYAPAVAFVRQEHSTVLALLETQELLVEVCSITVLFLPTMLQHRQVWLGSTLARPPPPLPCHTRAPPPHPTVFCPANLI